MDNLISREYFIELMNNLENQFIYDHKCSEAFSVILQNDYISGYDNGILKDTLIKLLSKIMFDDCNWIEYFVYELNFGKKWKENCVMINNKNFDLKTSSDLWNLLTKK